MKHKQGSQPHGGNPQNKAGDSTESPLHVKLIPSEDENEPQSKQQRNTGNSKQKPSKWWGKSDWVAAIATAVLAVFAFASFILLWIQLNDARKVFIGDQRPWIKVSELGEIYIGATETHSTLQLTNVGQTPTHDIKAFFVFDLIDNGTPLELDKWKNERIGTGAIYGTIFPRDSAREMPIYRYDHKTKQHISINETEMKDLKEGKAFLIIFGEVTYRDFANIEHWTRFCDWKDLGPGCFVLIHFRKCSF